MVNPSFPALKKSYVTGYVTLCVSARQRDAIDFPGTVFFQKGGAGSKGITGCRDIIDDPDSFSLEKILRSICIKSERTTKIHFSGFFVFLS